VEFGFLGLGQMGAGLGQLWRLGMMQGLGEGDITSLIRVLEGWAGAEVAAGVNNPVRTGSRETPPTRVPVSGQRQNVPR
jgi:hypothetical protein